MKSSVVLVVVIIVIAGLGVFAYYENRDSHKTVTGTHIYLGALYDGQTKYTNYVSANVEFANGPNLKNNVYYVVLSTWDSNNSYDQVGVSSLYGKFYSTYSYTEIVNGSIKYIFDPHWFQITPGTHSLSMYAVNGDVVFRFDNSTFTAFTGGNNFSIEMNAKVGNQSFSGFTVYEEIYEFNKTLPGISYNFSRVQYGMAGEPTGYVTNWRQFYHNVTSNLTSLVFMKSDTVNIYNKPSLVLKVNVQNLNSSAFLMISDVNLTLPSNGQYSINLLNGNYTLYLIYDNVVKSYNVSLSSNTVFQVTA